MSTSSSWRRSAGFIWAMIGSAVGFANLLSFSAHCYRGGGGAFLLPYFAAMLMIGIPMLLLESSIGQHFRSALVEACDRARGRWATLWGWLAVIACFTIGAFYTVLTGYSILYFGYALLGAIPQDTASFFRHDILALTSGLYDIGPLVFLVFLSTAAVLLISYFVNRKPVSRGIEKACSYFMPILGLLALSGAISVLFLPGASDAVMKLFEPRPEALRNASLWRDIFGQLFFSYSLGIGIVVGYSAHANQRISLLKAMTWVAMGDFAISLLAAIVIFGCIGAVSYEQGVAFETWLASDSTFEIGFVVYPKLLQAFGGWTGYFLQIVLFFCLFVAGITGVFSIIESIVGNLQWRFLYNRETTTKWTCIALLIASMPFCCGGGAHLIDALAPLVLGINMLLGAVAMITIFVWRRSTLHSHTLFESGFLRYYLLSVVLPWALVSLALILKAEILGSHQLDFFVRWTWFAMALATASFLMKKQVKELK